MQDVDMTATADDGPPLATALAKDRIVTLRHARRGVGVTSDGWRAIGFANNRHDAAALRALAGRPGIRADAIGVVGHSEGAALAMSLPGDSRRRADGFSLTGRKSP
jgi:alpha-beta hydrolase superfamily lysophospholipase